MTDDTMNLQALVGKSADSEVIPVAIPI